MSGLLPQGRISAWVGSFLNVVLSLAHTEVKWPHFPYDEFSSDPEMDRFLCKLIFTTKSVCGY